MTQDREKALRDALGRAKAHAKKMRNASKLVGPAEYQNDPKALKVWQRALYHEGKELMAALAMQEPASEPAPAIEADPDMVICPNCTHQFGAIPVNVQAALRASEPAPASAPMVCEGCGYTGTIEELRAKHPQALSCCPERKMVPAPASAPSYECLREAFDGDSVPAKNIALRKAYDILSARAQPCQCGELREALTLAEDVLSRSPPSIQVWPNGMHPQIGMSKIRDTLAAAAPRTLEGKP